MISDKALKAFKQIWQEEYGEEISDKEAIEKSINLLTMFNAVYKPIKKEWLNKSKNKNGN